MKSRWGYESTLVSKGSLLIALLSLATAACKNQQPVPHLPNSVSQGVSFLGTASSFAVLGGQSVTNTGATLVSGDLGVSPGTSVTGFPPGTVVGGTIHVADAVALQAQADNAAAYTTFAGEACNTDLTGQDLGGLTLTPGVYCFSSSAQLTGTLTLDAQGDANALFVFQIGSTLTTASNSSVLVINGASSCNVFWQVGSSATIGTTTTFVGNILALTSISLNTGASVDGRALAHNGSVTMDTNTITAGTCGETTSGSSGSVGTTGTSGSSGTSATSATTSGTTASTGTTATAGNSSGTTSGSTTAGSTSGNTTGSSATTGSTGTTSGCQGTICGCGCVDLNTDDQNCGACGNACATGETCSEGVCTSPCRGDTLLCGGRCVDVLTDSNDCGECGNVCASNEACSGGYCGNCPGTMCGAWCVDLGTDRNDCGSCGHACAANETCSDSACAPCAGSVCGNDCVDLNSDDMNCGACGHICGITEACVDGACNNQCPAP